VQVAGDVCAGCGDEKDSFYFPRTTEVGENGRDST